MRKNHALLSLTLNTRKMNKVKFLKFIKSAPKYIAIIIILMFILGPIALELFMPLVLLLPVYCTISIASLVTALIFESTIPEDDVVNI
jgi:hypothetical protein